MKVKAAVAASFFAFPAFGQECESIIALSKIVNTVVVDQDSLEKHASNFCSEYSKSSGTSSDRSFGASYKFLSASLNSSNASAESVASQYCSAADFSKAKTDAYKQYIESISPNAYSAYERCIEYSRSSVRFHINPATVLPGEASISVSFAASEGENKAQITFSSSSGVDCDWQDSSERVRAVGNTVEMQGPASVILKCTRTDAVEPDYISIVRADGTFEPISIPWQAYNTEGVPVNALASAQAMISNIQSSIANVQNQVNANTTSITSLQGRGLNVYQCPSGKTSGWNTGGGAWGFYGCQGQVSVAPSCTNIEYPHREERTCDSIGAIRLY